MVTEKQRRFMLASGIFFAILFCLSGGTAAVFLAQRYLGDEASQNQSGSDTLREAEASSLSQQGLLITSIDPTSPAGNAGLRRGQIILTMDGTPVGSPQALQRILQGHEPGDTFTLEILSGQQRENVTLILGEGAAYLGAGLMGSSSANSLPDTGAGSSLFSPAQPESAFPNSGFSQSLFGRALVVSLVSDSPAAKAGMQVGDIVTNIDEEAVLSNEELVTAIGGKSPGEDVVVTFRRDAETVRLTITLAPHPDDAGRGFLGVQLQAAPPLGSPDQ